MCTSNTSQCYSSCGVVPLALHRIVRGSAQEWEDVSKELFRRIIEHIGGRAFSFCGKSAESGRRWLLTFDDGRSTDYEMAFPMLLEFGISATFFLITDRIGQPGYVNWAQVREMHRNGMCIGSHGRTHRRLTDLSFDEAAAELTDSKQMLEDQLSNAVGLFSFPQGATNARLWEQGFAAGYSHLFTSSHGVIGTDDRVIPRNSIHSAMDWSAIARVMEPGPGTRFRWYAEDVAKRLVKRLVGYERYVRLRNRILHEASPPK